MRFRDIRGFFVSCMFKTTPIIYVACIINNTFHSLEVKRTKFKKTKQYSNSINLIAIEKRNQATSEKFFERAKEQFYQGQLSRNDFRLAQVDLSMSKNKLNQRMYSAKIAELNLYRLSGKILDQTK